MKVWFSFDFVPFTFLGDDLPACPSSARKLLSVLQRGRARVENLSSVGL